MATSNKRLIKEFAALQRAPVDDATITLKDETQMTEWTITIIGPSSTPYANGIFTLSMSFPAEYPFKPPTLKFITKVYHPNIQTETGEICASVINDEWGPTLNAKHCIETVVNMLKSPSDGVDSPLEEEIGKLLREKPAEFEKNAKKFTKQYAV